MTTTSSLIPDFNNFSKIFTQRSLQLPKPPSRIVLYLDLLIVKSNADSVCSIFNEMDSPDFDIVNYPELYGSLPTALTIIVFSCPKLF